MSLSMFTTKMGLPNTNSVYGSAQLETTRTWLYFLPIVYESSSLGNGMSATGIGKPNLTFLTLICQLSI